MLKCECCGSAKRVGTLSQLCSLCFQALSKYDTRGDEVRCSYHGKVLIAAHNR